MEDDEGSLGRFSGLGDLSWSLVEICVRDNGKLKRGNRCSALPFIPQRDEDRQRICEHHKGPLVRYKGRDYLPCTYGGKG